MEISTVSSEEYVYLVSSLYILDEKKFQCGECQNQYRNHQKADEMTKGVMQSKFCVVPSDRHIHNIDGRIWFKKCIGNYFLQSTSFYLELFKQYENGVMPYCGALVDQPNKIIEIFRVIGQYRNEKEMKILKQKNQQLGHQMRKNGRR